MHRLSDEQLLDEVIAGEMVALATLVERYQHVLTGYLDRLMVADWALAQDLAQETFLRVLRQQATRGNRPFKSWLYAIATNLARDHFKSSATRLSTPLASEHEVSVLDEVPGPEEYALRGEQRSALVDALNLLGMEYRTTVRRSLDEGTKPAEMAYVLVFAPTGTSLKEMVEAFGARWTVEQCFEEGKGEVGLDEYEVRSWHGWYRHVTL